MTTQTAAFNKVPNYKPVEIKQDQSNEQVEGSTEGITGKVLDTIGRRETQILKRNGNEESLDCVRINLTDKHLDGLFEHAPFFVKVDKEGRGVEVKARQVTNPDGELLNEELHGIEGEKVQQGDWILTNPKGEKYPIPKDTFEASYISTDKEGVYESLPMPKKLVKSSENVVFHIPDWDTDMALKKGDYLVELHHPPKGEKIERYGMAKEAAADTHMALDDYVNMVSSNPSILDKVDGFLRSLYGVTLESYMKK